MEVQTEQESSHLPAFYLILSLPVSGQRIAEAVLCPVDTARFLPPHPVEKIHITVFTPLRALPASVPGIPDVMHCTDLLPYRENYI